MINELILIANSLDSKGFSKEADYLDSIIKDSEEEESEPRKESKWHKMKMSKAVEEMEKNQFNTLTFELNGYNIRISKVREE